jgi:16S rRNA C967 or C1407 C5-methylase (RsmB/RsmF family)/NOL1/NOP2/fmu family ribosome biogenesis protein
LNTKLPVSLKLTLPESLHIDWQALEDAHALPPINSVRMNPKKRTAQFDQEAMIPWCKQGRYLHIRPSFTFDPLFHAGTYYVQEASSMFLETALMQHIDFNVNLKVLDLCASPGGKSTHIASLLNEQSLLISNEVIGTRVNMLCENMTKWGYDNTWVTNNDPIQFKKVPSFFDMMLVDAPCSGSGLFRKMPDYCQTWNPELVNLCAQRQKRILNDAYDALAKNGLLVYMTCSLSQDENEDMLDYIMQTFDVTTCKIQIDETWGIMETQSEKMHAFGYRFFPHLVKGEGFFLALFQKNDGATFAMADIKSHKVKKNFDVSKYINDAKMFVMPQHENLIAIQEIHKHYLDYLQTKLKIVKKGILIGKLLPKEIIPTHELALYEKCVFNDHIIDLDLKNAIAYLKKETFEHSMIAKGWYLVTFEGFALGWLKNIGNRINNYYPSNDRILSKNPLPS